MTDYTGGNRSNNFSDTQLRALQEQLADLIEAGYTLVSPANLSTILAAMIAAGQPMPAPLVQELTASGAVTAGVQSLELNHTSVTIEATIADAVNHQGLFIVKATTEPGVGGDHTLTLTAGTFDGTNNVATFADINDALVVFFDSAGNGTILENVGTVGLA